MQLPSCLTELEKSALIKFELESHSSEADNQSAESLYFDFNILGKSKEDNNKEEAIVYFNTNYHIAMVINVFKLANLNLSYVDIDSFVYNKILNSQQFENILFSHKVDRKDLLKTADSWFLTLAIAIRVFEKQNINLLPWRQVEAHRLYKKRAIYMVLLLIIFISIEGYRYYLSLRLNHLENYIFQQTDINKKTIKKIEQIHFSYLKILTQIREIEVLKAKQQKLWEWFDELVTKLPAAIMFTTVEMKENDIKIIASTYEYKDISNFITNLSQSRCFLACNLQKLELAYKGKVQRLNYIVHVQLKLNTNHFCREL